MSFGIPHSARGWTRLAPSPENAADVSGWFAVSVPAPEGYVMTCKTRPYEPADDVEAQVVKAKRNRYSGRVSTSLSPDGLQAQR